MLGDVGRGWHPTRGGHELARLGVGDKDACDLLGSPGAVGHDLGEGEERVGLGVQHLGGVLGLASCDEANKGGGGVEQVVECAQVGVDFVLLGELVLEGVELAHRWISRRCALPLSLLIHPHPSHSPGAPLQWPQVTRSPP
jgi:hypothetical protein